MDTSDKQKVVLITGASSGIGFATAKLFAQRGWIVYAGARRVERMEELEDYGVNVLALDVTNKESSRIFVNTAKTEQQRIDVLINNAGYGEFGALEEVSSEKARAQFDVNLFGLSQLTHFALPIMRRQHAGRIINTSSIASDVYTPFGGWYYSSKAALNQWSDVLDSESRRFGIRSVIVQPGPTQSQWSEIAFKNGFDNLSENSPYGDTAKKFMKVFSLLSKESNATAEDLAKVFYRASTDKHPKYRYYNQFRDHALVSITRHFPRTYRNVIDKIFD
ncbi:short-chain dehydrogenase/reductase [Xylocopilactobacillus apicola]|uniref:Short-chain dehydrogenase/reductase n=2 Tax=Xylocopilactobacillus apicola TaxID=2932184 RepID=A0AAU9DLM0_9LACO|nr:SDR family NAD(P)-dependent oxidoreductase [Xylocopilactobacillus apicola]BDR57792.1 short-chain dehydrogenase/reductase [Xylocopilactobacillus apicola]